LFFAGGCSNTTAIESAVFVFFKFNFQEGVSTFVKINKNGSLDLGFRFCRLQKNKKIRNGNLTKRIQINGYCFDRGLYRMAALPGL